MDVGARLARIESMLVTGTRRQVFDARGFLIALWRGKWVIGATSLIAAIAAALLLLWLPNEYKAEAILLPAAGVSGAPMGGLGQLGGLASLAGLDVSGLGSGSENATIAMELVKTWSFLDQFIHENQLQVPLLATKGWDPVDGRLLIDADRYDPESGRWSDPPGDLSGSGEPGSWRLYEELRDRIEVSRDGSTGLIYLSVVHYSPVIARDWVDALVTSVNRHLQERDQQDARRNIAYLQKQVEQTPLAGMKAVFYRLIEEQTKNLMLAEVSDEYALRTVSPAKVPEKKDRPARFLITVLAGLSGALLGVFVWLTFLHDRTDTRAAVGK